MILLAYVAVPKDLAKVRSKLIFNLTPRQLICFGGAAIVGAPAYFLTRGVLGSSLSTILLVVLALPFFFLAMYEKDGQPFEKVLWTMIQAKYLFTRLRGPIRRKPSTRQKSSRRHRRSPHQSSGKTNNRNTEADRTMKRRLKRAENAQFCQ